MEKNAVLLAISLCNVSIACSQVNIDKFPQSTGTPSRICTPHSRKVNIDKYQSTRTPSRICTPHSIQVNIDKSPQSIGTSSRICAPHSVHGFHFFRLTNFPDFSSIFCSFPVFFKVLLFLKVWYHIRRVFTITG